MNKPLKTGLVVVGSVLLSTLAINASDVFRGIDGSLSGLAIESLGPCGANAALMQFGDRALCVDLFEASADPDCPNENPLNEIETSQNLDSSACVPASVSEVQPWRFVTLTQAQQLCARTGKRLPTNEEWYKTVVGMGDVSMCAIKTAGSSPDETGTNNCTTPAGIHDMVGNVWEWIDGEVSEGIYNNRELPETGYVSLVDSAGVVIETSNNPENEYGEDYAWTSQEGVKGIIRGGFYGSGSDAGIFTLNASVPLDFKTAGVGFRCVRDI